MGLFRKKKKDKVVEPKKTKIKFKSKREERLYELYCRGFVLQVDNDKDNKEHFQSKTGEIRE